MKDPLAVLEQAKLLLSSLAEVCCGALADVQLVSVTVAAEEVSRRVDAVKVLAAAELEARSGFELGEAGLSRRYGHRRASLLVEQLTRVSAAEAQRRIRLGTQLRPRSELGSPVPPLYPVVSDAVMHGELGVEAAAHIVRALSQAAPRCEVADLTAAETALVAAGATGSADLVADQARAWRDHLDTGGAEPRADRQHAMREFRIGRERDDGMTPFSGLADPVSAGTLKAALAAFRVKPRMLDEDEADLLDLMPAGPTREQHDFDTVLGLIRAGLGADSTVVPGGRASVVATVRMRDLRDGEGVGWIDDIRESVPVSTIDLLACDAGMEIAITGDNGALLALTSNRRFFTRTQRRALAARDGGCVIPGCDAPASWTIAHHVIEDQHGGRTEISNGVLLCPPDHRMIHRSRYRLKMIRGTPHMLAPPEIDRTQTWRPIGRARHNLLRQVETDHPLSDTG